MLANDSLILFLLTSIFVLRKAIVKFDEGQWKITNIGLTDSEIDNLRHQLDVKKDYPDYEIDVDFDFTIIGEDDGN